MPNLREYSLALFGKIDEEVILADKDDTPTSAAVIATVENLLPNSTALGQRDWYGELEDFVNLPRIRKSDGRVEFPSFDEAKRGLYREPSPERDHPDAELQAEDRHPALARAVYAVVVLEKIRRVKNQLLAPGEPELNVDQELMNLLPGLVNPWPKVARAENGEIQRVYSTAEKVDSIEAAIDQIYDHESWRIKAGGAVSREFALCAEPCFGTLEDSGGQYCSTVYTCCEAEDLTVDDLKKIVHPLNWNVCCPSFFQAMAAKPPPKYTRDGWSRIVEVISPEPAKYSLATALIFWMQELDDGSIIINYDLDPNRGEVDSGYVEIDNGYIRVTPTPNPLDGKGVRIETSKQERVGGLSPTATAALACLLGWGDNGKEMLAGTARKLINGELPPGTTLTDWGVSTRPLAAGVQFDTSPPSPPPKIPPKLPPNFPDTVDDSRKLLNSLINRTTKNLGEAGHRWMDGVIRRDVEDVTTQMGTDLKEWSLEVYDTAQDNVKPPKGAN